MPLTAAIIARAARGLVDLSWTLVEIVRLGIFGVFGSLLTVDGLFGLSWAADTAGAEWIAHRSGGAEPGPISVGRAQRHRGARDPSASRGTRRAG